MIILPHDLIATYLQATEQLDLGPVSFIALDDGDAFVSTSLLRDQGKNLPKVNGLIKVTLDVGGGEVDDLPDGVDVLVLTHLVNHQDSTENQDYSNYQFDGWVRCPTGIEQHSVQIIRFSEEVFSRIHGLYETDVLQAKRVLIIGVGSGGSSIAVELAKAGVADFILVDHDRLEVANIVRHVCGISDLGRFKTKAVRDQILEKNPFARVETFQKQCDWDWLPQLKELVRNVDIIFCCTDNRPSRMLVNLASISEGRICIYGGTFNRAYGGHVLRVIPGQTMCYQCFIDILPEKAEDQEIASEAQANSVAYDDRPVPVEPGLANDIAPIATMCVKLGILELLRGTETTLASLYEDLSNSWYQWLNRRESGTDYAGLKPLDSEDSDGLRILAWYGIANEKDPGCPVCGDFIGVNISAHVGEIKKDQIEAFGGNSQELPNAEESFPPPDHE